MGDDETRSIYEGLRAWWPTYDSAGTRPFLPGDISHGAKATRCIGRLAFWHHGIEIYRLLERKIRRTLEVSSLRREEVPATGNTAKVFIICSLAGGSGSGMMLDITYMCRHLLNNERLIGFVTGLLLADAGPFSEIVQEEGLRRRMEANIYAALCELDWLMGGYRSENLYQARQSINQREEASLLNGNPITAKPTPSSSMALNNNDYRYEMLYPNRLRIRSNEKPFDICYLVTSTNEHSRRLCEIENLAEMTAQSIFLEIATPLGRTGRSQLDNVERLGSFSDYKARPLAYSSFAVASLNFTSELIGRQAVLKLTDLVIDRLLAHNAFMEQQGHGFDSRSMATDLIADLALHLPSDDEAVVMALDAAPEVADHLDIPACRFSAGAQGVVYQTELLEYERRVTKLIEQDLTPAYKNAEQQQAAVYRQSCDLLVRQGLGQQLLSIADLVTFMSNYVTRLDEAATIAEQESILAQQESTSARATVSEGMARLDRDLKSPERYFGIFPTNKLEQVAATARPIGEQLHQLTETRRDVLRWRSANTVLEQTCDYMREHIKRLQQLRKDLEAFKRELHRALDSIQGTLGQGSLQYQLEFEALTIEDVNSLVKTLLAEISADELGKILTNLVATSSTQRRSSDVDTHPLVQELDRLVHNWLQRQVRGLPELLFEINQDDNSRIERQLKRLVEYAEPFASLDLTRCPEVKQWSLIHLIGYNGAGRGGQKSKLSETLTRLVDRFSPVNTENPNQIVFLKTKHGLPLFAMSVLRGMMRVSYHEHREAWLHGDDGYRPIHLSQQWASVADFNPAAVEK